jgi:hypothetical protein
MFCVISSIKAAELIFYLPYLPKEEAQSIAVEKKRKSRESSAARSVDWPKNSGPGVEFVVFYQ